MNFLTFGPFPIPLDITEKSDELAKLFNNAKDGLNNASGVYIFIRKSDEMLVPVYVGRTIDNSFGGRLASHFNRPHNKSLRELWESSSSNVEIFLIAAADNDGALLNFKVDSARLKEPVKWLEDVMIGSCYEINHDLFNMKITDFYRKTRVPGYVNETSEDLINPAARALAKMLRKDYRS